MTDKAKKVIIRTLAAVGITFVYFYIACFVGNIISFISLSFSAAFESDILTWALIFVPPVLFFTFIDNRLFDPLHRLFGHSALVYAVLSGNFMTLRGIILMISAHSLSDNYSGLEKIIIILLAIPVTSLLGGVLFCFLIRLLKTAKENKLPSDTSE